MTMTLSEYGAYDGVGLADLLRRGDVTAKELAEVAIAGVEKVNPELNAVIETYYDRLDGLADRPLADGPFGGVPFFVKDIGCTERGRRQECGSRLTKGFVGRRDSHLMTKFKQAGLVVLGRTTTPEFGYTGTTESILTGATRNPWNTERIAGGSSGGSSAIVAAGVVPMAQGGDGAGSVRIPASCCGLVGLKASRGRVSVGPDSSLMVSPNLAHFIGCRTVRDAAAMLDAIHGPGRGDPFQIAPPKRPYMAVLDEPAAKLRVAVASQAWGPYGGDTEVIDALGCAAKLCQDLGHEVEEARPDIDYGAFYKAFGDFWFMHIPPALDRLAAVTGRAVDETTVEPVTLAMYEEGKKYSAADVYHMLHVMNGVTRSVAAFFDRYDLLLTPTLGAPPLPFGQISLDRTDLGARDFMDLLFRFIPYTPLANFTGDPAISLPLVQTADNLPIGIQAMAAFGREDLLLSFANSVEDAQPWAGRKPAVSVAGD